MVLMNLALLALYSNTLIQLFKFWSTSYAYSHGIILFPIVLVLYFYELYKAPKLNLSLINGFSLFYLLGLVFLWFAADLLTIQFVEFFSFWLILILFNLLLTSDKLKNTIHLWPLLLIVFALPLWDFLSEILRTIETPMVVLALNATSIKAIQDGFLIYIPAGTFLVEHACSGFNQFIVSIPLAVLYSYTRKLNFVTGFKFALFLLLLAILFNILRIYIVLVAGQLTHMKSPLVVDSHEYLAWLIYGIGVFILFFIADRRLKLTISDKQNIPPTNIHINRLCKMNSGKLILLAAVLVVGPLFSISYPVFRNNSLINFEQLTDKIYWKEVDNSSVFQFTPAFASGDRVYQHKLESLLGQSVTLYINYFVHQEQGREAINDSNSLVTHDDKLIADKPYIVKLSDGRELKVNESIVRLKSGEQYLVWQWYFTNGQYFNGSMDARLNNLRGILKNNPAIANIVLFKRFGSTQHLPRNTLKAFVVDNIAVLSQYLKG